EATRQHSPIDPSESSKQFAVLLEYLAQSLDGKDNVLARTPASEDHLALEAADEGDFSAEMSAQLTLSTTISLPRPLRPLSFAFALARQEPAAFSRVVLRPALQGTEMVNRKVAALLDVVRDKDHVIARLLERVGNQASGDMSLVFPTLTGRRGRGGEKVGVEEAGRLVPGLKEFELGEWERERGFEHGGGFEGLVKEGGLAETLGGEERNGAWARHLPGPEALARSGDDMNGKRRLSRQVTRDTTRGSQADGDNDDEDDDATESEDEFERQPTPPSTRKTTGSTKTTPQKSAATAQQASGNPSSSDKDDSGPPAKKQKTSGGNIGSGKRAGRLGGLRGGRNKPAERTVSSSPEQDAAPTAIPAAIKDNDEGEKRRPSTASTATASATDSEAEPPPPTTRSSKAQKKGGDGGKREPTPPTASPSPEPAPSEAPSSGKKKGRLGRLGGRDKGRTTDPRSSSVEASDGTATTGRHKLGKLGGARRGRKQADTPAPDTGAEETQSEDGDGDAAAAAAAAAASGGSEDKVMEAEGSSGRRAGQHKKALPLPAPKKEDRENEDVPSAPTEPEPEPQEPETAEQ
ncbi:MAG: hypothetical protein INR71_13320, partial [Terriglobus roseus]|nr:hypothetical protein [Terriglobus roseus]